MQNQVRRIRLLLLHLSAWVATSCGGNALGNHLYLMEGDKKEDRIIVYCSRTDFGQCISGMFVLPLYQRQYGPKGNYAEYVESAVAEREWVMVRTVRVETGRYNYWLIRNTFNIDRWDCARQDCDGVIQQHVAGPMELRRFDQTRQALGLSAPFH